jgi:gamma-glutamylcyclotransferase (GGCT)/AIG2-like uncharacterized protein YtfP
MMQLPLFVYGTLRPGGERYHLVEPHLTGVQAAEIAGLQLWDLGPYPMAIEGMGRVRGELLALDPETYEMVLARLDIVEGVDPLVPTKPGGLYWRARRTVILPGCGGPLPEAWVYLGSADRAMRGRRIQSGDWRQRGQGDSEQRPDERQEDHRHHEDDDVEW